MAISQAELKKLYKDRREYVRRVERNLDEATKQGWFLPVYRSVVLADAAAVDF
jgi:Alpha/beta hydrolase domain